MQNKDPFLPFAVPTIEADEIDEVVETLKSGWLSIGPKTHAFEQQFAEYTAVPHAVALNSCTAALHLALLAHGIGHGDEVILPSLTFAATANMVVNVGAIPVFAEILPDTYCIDPMDAAQRVTKKTKAIIPVHYAGHPAEMTALKKIAREHNLVIIEDAAHAVGGEYKGSKIGSLGNTTCFSFYATKNLCTGEGGMLATPKKRIDNYVRINRSHGISKDAWKRYAKGGNWRYEVINAGWKYNMTDVQASLGMHQLKKLDRFNQQRRNLAALYTDSLKDVSEIQLPVEKNYAKHVFHLYAIQILSGKRDRLIEKLADNNIGSSVHFIPLHLQPFYRNYFNYKKGSLPVTERVGRQILSLPLYPSLTEQDVDRVTTVLKKLL